MPDKKRKRPVKGRRGSKKKRASKSRGELVLG
jgi:hypothetical protein